MIALLTACAAGQNLPRPALTGGVPPVSRVFQVLRETRCKFFPLPYVNAQPPPFHITRPTLNSPYGGDRILGHDDGPLSRDRPPRRLNQFTAGVAGAFAISESHRST